MRILLKNAIIIDSESSHNGLKKDILIEGNTIKEISNSIKISDDTKIVEDNNLYVSTGWFDCNVNFGEPGYEHIETIESGLNAAAKGGFTSVAVMPNTEPTIDNSSGIHFLREKSKEHIVDLFPIGALTKKCKGEELAESYDMVEAGAIAFSDNKNTVTNSDTMKLALLYNKELGKKVIAFPDTKDLSGGAHINEGIKSTQLGLKGNPSLSEELQLSRDISLMRYTKGNLHIQNISTHNSISLIENAKKEGMQISCHVTPHHISLTEDELDDFDTLFKVKPPLRSKKDVEALKLAIKKGIIDAISSDHTPINIEDKKCEFEYAKPGTIGLESCFGVINRELEGDISIEEIINLINSNPKNIFGIKNTKIEEGEKANLTLFNPDIKWIFTEKDIMSKSKNSMFIKKELKGKVIGIYNKGRLLLNA
ncbi:dihydroorotase [Ichthyobacterium seriolicida]|uniref:Dihydroorotase n=1 Tax=Ichthyobacterium seriolicida TaxID=242600 RepID=A0A1J1DX66_9FLAO|nr:dihydroorotase [Ichthyobacterium seriolicida]BAV94433.1 dihydroorotase [Ichthyobacterium seriolicida]